MSEPSEPPAGSRVSASHSWWTLSVVLAVALAALIAIVSNSGVLSIDLDVARRIQEIDSPGWVAFLNFGEGLTNLRGGLLGCAVLTAGFWFRGLPAATVTIVIAPAIWVPKQLIEDFVARPRPTVDLVEITQTAEGFSFPSGHVTAGVAVYGMLAIIAILSFRPPWAKVRYRLPGRSDSRVLGPVASCVRGTLAYGRARCVNSRCPMAQRLGVVLQMARTIWPR